MIKTDFKLMIAAITHNAANISYTLGKLKEAEETLFYSSWLITIVFIGRGVFWYIFYSNQEDWISTPVLGNCVFYSIVNNWHYWISWNGGKLNQFKHSTN